MDDPYAQGPLPEPFLEHGLLTAVYFHGQPVQGWFEYGPEPGHYGDPGPAVVVWFFLVCGGERVRRRRGAVSTAAGIARVLRETRVSCSIHGGGPQSQPLYIQYGDEHYIVFTMISTNRQVTYTALSREK